jgi:hypothetical protein
MQAWMVSSGLNIITSMIDSQGTNYRRIAHTRTEAI